MTDEYTGPKLIAIDGDKTEPSIDFIDEPDLKWHTILKR